ncbi:hypothetical protein D3C71_1699480 [compost metagenome]
MRNGLLGVVGFAGNQQAIDRCFAVRCFGGYRVALCFAVFDQCQPASRLISLQACGIAHNQLHRNPGPSQTRGP